MARFWIQTCRDSGFKIEIDGIRDSDLDLQDPIKGYLRKLPINPSTPEFSLLTQQDGFFPFFGEHTSYDSLGLSLGSVLQWADPSHL